MINEPNGESDKLKQGGGDTPGPIKSAQGRNSETPASTSASGGASGAASGVTSAAAASAAIDDGMEGGGGTGRLTRLTVGTNRSTPAAASGLTTVDDAVVSGSPLPLPVEGTEVEGVQCTVEELVLVATVA